MNTDEKVDFTRYNMYRQLDQYLVKYHIIDQDSEFSKILKISSTIIKSIESELYTLEVEEFIEILRGNMNDLSTVINTNVEEFLKEIPLILENKSNKTKKEVFKKVIKILISLQEKNFPKIDFAEISNKNYDANHNFVFLSYAYDDRGYTLALFYYFLNRGIYLYIDWMHNGKITSGIDLKAELNKHLYKANQFLLLRTLNSEFSIKGSGNIKQWCSWEMGQYYSKNKDEKFYITTIDNKENPAPKNLILDGFHELKDIVGKRMV